jgi:ribose transport system substrate-binding protein
MFKRSRLAAAVVPLALIAAACGSDEKESAPATEAAKPAASEAPAPTEAPATDAPAPTEAPATEAPTTEPAGDDAGVEAAKAAVAALAEPPEAIGPTIAIEGEIPKKTVAWLECEQPSCAAIRPGFEAATEALGWELLVIPANSGAQGDAIQQALDQGADYLAHTGSPLATAEEQLAAAKEKGVPYASCYSTDDPDVDNNNLLIQCGDDDGVFYNGGLMANWVIADSGGQANVLVVNIPDFPVLVSEADGIKDAYSTNCSACTVQELNVTIDALIAGEVGGAIASQIQANEDINYIQFTFGDLPAGVADVLEESGLLEGRKIVGVDFSAAIGLPEIVAGRHHAWTANPKVYAAWLMVDAMVRHSVGMDNPEERQNAALPVFIVDSPEAATAALEYGDSGWPGPATMADQFKTLWGV